MGEEMLNRIGDAIYLLNQLERQLEENIKSFNHSVKGDLADDYTAQTKKAIEKCNALKKQLYQLRDSESAKLISGQ